MSRRCVKKEVQRLAGGHTSRGRGASEEFKGGRAPCPLQQAASNKKIENLPKIIR